MADVQISTNIRLDKTAEGLGDAVKRIELLEEFLCVVSPVAHRKIVTLWPRRPTLTLRADHEKIVDALDDFRFGRVGGGQVT